MTQQTLSEALAYKDLEGMMKPTIHVDEFAAKMGDDDEIIVVSFFVKDTNAARDLVDWFEKGYDFIMDADQSPGEIKPGRFLVYVEMRRRTSAARNIERMLDDLSTLTEYNVDDWRMHYEGETHPFSQEVFERFVPLSPAQYRKEKETNLNEMRTAAGIPEKQIFKREKDIRELQNAAGI